MSSNYHVYILKCSDDSYYIGQTDDLEQRLTTHSKGHGPRYTASRLPIVFVHSESYASRAEATQRENQLKKWSRGKKESLIEGRLHDLKHLSKSHDRA